MGGTTRVAIIHGMRYQLKELKVLIWDLETTNLQADFGSILCVGWKWLGEDEVHIIAINDFPYHFKKDPTNEKELLKEFLKVYSEADISITYFGGLGNFDLPFFQAKILQYSLDLPKKVEMIDLFYTAKSNLKLSSKSLKNVAKFLKLENQKDQRPLEGKVWMRARAFHEPSLNYVYDHCVDDVNCLEELYLKLRPLIRTHPRMGDCRFCGKGPVQRRGLAVTRAKPRQRVQCQSCGAWDQVPLPRGKFSVQ